MEINQALLFTYNEKKARALTNLKVLLENPVGIGEHGDIINEIEKELKEVAHYEDLIDAMKKYFPEIDELFEG